MYFLKSDVSTRHGLDFGQKKSWGSLSVFIPVYIVANFDMSCNCQCWTRSIFKLEHVLANAFGNWGRFVSRHPSLVIVASVTFAAVLSAFIVNMKSETRTRYLYAPTVKFSCLNQILLTLSEEN